MSFRPGDNLRQVLPHDAELELDGRDKRLAALLDVPVLAEFDPRLPGQHWEGTTHRNVTVWWALEDGHAVAFNENPSVGWSFPVRRLSPADVDEIRRDVEKKRREAELAHAVIVLHPTHVSWSKGPSSGSNPIFRDGLDGLAATLNAVMNTLQESGARTFEFLGGN